MAELKIRQIPEDQKKKLRIMAAVKETSVENLLRMMVADAVEKWDKKQGKR